MSTASYPVTDTQTIYRGAVVTLHRDTVLMSDGASAQREVVEHPGAVGVVALDEHDRVVLVNQYRHPVRAWLDELPAGLLDVPGESALSAARRELAEEAALHARDWNVLVDLHTSPGMTSEAIRIYLARGLTDVAEGERFVPEHEEITLTVRRVPLADALHAALSGALTNAAAVAGVLAAVACTSGQLALRPADAPWPARPER